MKNNFIFHGKFYSDACHVKCFSTLFAVPFGVHHGHIKAANKNILFLRGGVSYGKEESKEESNKEEKGVSQEEEIISYRDF